MISPDGNDRPFVLDVQDQLTRRNGTEEAGRNLEQMWARCRAFDQKWADHFRKRTALRLLCIPGRGGAGMVRAVYKLAHLVVRFN